MLTQQYSTQCLMLYFNLYSVVVCRQDSNTTLQYTTHGWSPIRTFNNMGLQHIVTLDWHLSCNSLSHSPDTKQCARWEDIVTLLAITTMVSPINNLSSNNAIFLRSFTMNFPIYFSYRASYPLEALPFEIYKLTFARALIFLNFHYRGNLG